MGSPFFMSTPELSYGGYSLLHDKDRAAHQFFDNYHPIDQLITEVERSLHQTSSRTGDRDDSYVGIPVPNYPDEPKLRINQLYWPTGAGRWSKGYFLCEQAIKDKLVASSDFPVFELKASTGVSTLTADMYLLPPRQLSNVEGKTNNLWLLPLVDERYYWQFRHFGTTSISSWSSLFTSLGTQLGVTITADTINNDYLEPDHIVLNRKYDNAAVILDAVAHSLNQRIVRQLDGTISSVGPSGSVTTNDSNHAPTDEDWVLISGGQYYPDPVPDSLDVLFPKASCAVPRCDKDYYQTTHSASTYISDDRSSLTGTTKTVHSALWANYNNAQSTFKNESDCDNLGSRYATDYYAWQTAKHHDVTYAGIKSWTLSGIDDHVLYTFGCESDRGKLSALTNKDGSVEIKEGPYPRRYLTRIQSPPGNFGVDQQLSNNVSADAKSVIVPVKLTQALAAGGSATANQMFWSGSAWTEDVQCGVTVHEPFGLASFDTGDRIFVRTGCDSNRFETIQTTGSGNSIIRVKAKEFFQPGGVAATMDKWEWVSNAWQDSGVDVGCRDDNIGVCLLTNEFAWAMQVDADDYVLIGPQGLWRKVSADALILPGESGTCSIIDHFGIGCAGLDSGENISVCNGGSYTTASRAILPGEVFSAVFHEWVWHAEALPQRTILGTPFDQQILDGNSGSMIVMKFVGGSLEDSGAPLLTVQNETGITLRPPCLYEIFWPALSDEAHVRIFQFTDCG